MEKVPDFDTTREGLDENMAKVTSLDINEAIQKHGSKQ